MLPEPVLAGAAEDIREVFNSGMSVLEVSHRGPEYEKIYRQARERLLKLMGLSESTYAVFFLGGGASLQFAQVPMNFLSSGQSADFLHTGEWPGRAIEEARFFGTARVAGSSAETRFDRIPRSLQFDPSARYVHLCTNNTIEGTHWSTLPETGAVPLVLDASSDFLGRSIDYSRAGLIFAGAQKNLGPAGVTVVVARREWIEKEARKDVPAILSYRNLLKHDGLYNTPPVFGVAVVARVLEWLEGQGGVASVQERNQRKAELLYAALEAHPEVFEIPVTEAQERSWMNVVFRLKDPSREAAFLKGAQAQGMDGLKGHRSVGGLRASIYNAFPEAGCRVLADYLHRFARGV